jgi:hypothetical protein
MEATGSRLILYRNKESQFRIWPFADVHLGNAGCAKHQLAADIQQVKDDPYSVWLLIGDYADFIAVGDKRFDATVIDENIKANEIGSLGSYLMEKVREFFDPIKDKCLGAGFGNHEHSYMKQKDQAGLHGVLCKHLDVANLMYSGFFDMYFKRDAGLRKGPVVVKKNAGVVTGDGVLRIRVMYHHGFSAAATAGGKVNALKKLVDQFEANLVISGHVHEQFAKAFVRLGADETCTKIVEKPVLGLITGSYMRTYKEGLVGYGENKAYPPTVLGVACARVIPCQRRLIAENGVLIP